MLSAHEMVILHYFLLSYVKSWNWNTADFLLHCTTQTSSAPTPAPKQVNSILRAGLRSLYLHVIGLLTPFPVLLLLEAQEPAKAKLRHSWLYCIC